MGLLDRIHEHHAQHVAEVAEDHYKAAMAHWQEADAHLRSVLRVAQTFNGQAGAENPNLTLVLKRNERAYFPSPVPVWWRLAGGQATTSAATRGSASGSPRASATT